MILEDFEKKILIHQDTFSKDGKTVICIYFRISLISLLHHFTKDRALLRPSLTHFVTYYFILSCFLEYRDPYIRMFISIEILILECLLVMSG